MGRFIGRFVINALALTAAIFILQPHINVEGNRWVSILVLAVIFGLVNAILKPILIILSCPLLILTLGLGTIIINALLFLLTGWIGQQFGFGFTVENFWYALLGALIVSVVSFILSRFLHTENSRI
jgi:putative membrane protein